MAKNNEDQNNNEEEVFESWDFKRVAIGVILLIIIIVGFYYFLKPQFLNFAGKNVLGIVNKSDVEKGREQLEKISPQEDLNALINQAKDQLSKITPDNLASSTSELQKILNDVKSLQEKKKEPKDIFCEYLCRK